MTMLIWKNYLGLMTQGETWNHINICIICLLRYIVFFIEIIFKKYYSKNLSH